MRKKGIIQCLILSSVLLLMCVFLIAQETQAASNKKKLIKGKEYTTTLTGTKKHTIKYKHVDGKYGTEGMKLFIDGKCVKQLNCIDWPRVYLFKVKKNRTLIYIHDPGESGDINYIRIFEFKNNKLKQLKNLVPITTGKYSNALQSADFKSVGNNQITVRWFIRSDKFGVGYCVDIPYTVNGTKITRKGTSYQIKAIYAESKKVTASRKFKVYTKAGGSKVAFTVKKNQKITLTKLYGKNGVTYIQIKNANGKTGWMKDTSDWSSLPHSKEAMYAG